MLTSGTDSTQACTFTDGLCIQSTLVSTIQGYCCDLLTGLQWHQEPVTGVFFGFALPQNVSGAGLLGDDFVANITVPLPYGFSALQGGSSQEASP